jgi:hypothetical protein
VLELDISTLPLQVECSPSAEAKCFALMLGKGLVSVSAVMSSVGQYIREIFPSCTTSRIK